MALLSSQDEQILKQHLSAISKPVTLLFFTQTFGGSESGPVTKTILDEVAALHEKITVAEKNFVLRSEERRVGKECRL